MTGSTAPDRLRPWPVVGRDNELAPLAAIAISRESPGAVIVGSAGVGKTRLALEAFRIAEGAGRPAIRVHGSQAIQQMPLAALGGLLPPGFAVEASSTQLVSAALSAITGRYEGTGTLVLVDDAHRLDDVAAYVLYRAVAAELFTVIVTLRSGEPVSEAITALWKDQGARRIDLQPLTPEDIETLVRSTLDGVVASDALHRLTRVAAGNPLVLRELLFGATEDGGLVRIGGVWQLVAPLTAARQLGELIDARLADLSPPERDALELLVVGQQLDLGELHRLVGTGPVEGLERKGLLAVHEEGSRLHASLVHPIYEEALRARMPTTAQMRHCRTLADAAEERGLGRRDDLMRWAVWRSIGGGTVDADLITFAAERALVQRVAAPLRERVSRLAFESKPTVEIGMVLCLALYDLGRLAEADVVLGQIEERAGTRRAQIEVAIARSWLLGFGAGQIERALRALRRTRATVGDDRDEIMAQEGTLLAYAGAPLSALYRVEPLLDALPESVRCRANVGAAMAYLLTGEFDAAERCAQVVIACHGDTGNARAFVPTGGLFAVRLRALSESGRAEEARTLGQRALRASVVASDVRGQGCNAAALAGAELTVGDLSAARGHALEAAAIFAGFAHHWAQSWSLAVALMAAVFQGDREAADELAGQLDERTPGDHQVRLFQSEVDRSRVWHLSLTDLVAARQAAAGRIQSFWSAGAVAPAVTFAHDLVRLGDPVAAARWLSRLTIPPGWALGNAFARHISAAECGDARLLAECGVAFEELGCPMYAAEAAMEAAAAGTVTNPREATRQQTRASVLALRCGGLRTPLLRLGRNATPLTRRELELSALAARGATNREIARRLVISERTVENHLSRVYAKLGVGGRGDLLGVFESWARPA